MMKKINQSAILAALLKEFLAVITDPTQINRATLETGFLKASILTKVVAPIAPNSTYVPLSALIEAGLINDEGNFIVASTVAIEFDKNRTQAEISAMGLTYASLNQSQQLVLAAAYRAAATKIGETYLAVDLSSVDELAATLIKTLNKELGALAFGGISKKIQFNSQTTHLTEAAITAIKEAQQQFEQRSTVNLLLSIPKLL